MRLIDAMAYRKVLDEEMDYLLENTKHSIKYRLGIEVAIADLGDMPTIDAEPVVRCGECVIRHTELCSLYMGQMNETAYFIQQGDDFFCKKGRRSDNG